MEKLKHIIRNYFNYRDKWLKDKDPKDAAIMRSYEVRIRDIIKENKELQQWLAK